MHRRPRWLWIGARVGKRIDVIQILHSARQRHLAGPLYLGRNGRLLSDRAFFSTIQRRQHAGLVSRRESTSPPSHSRSDILYRFLLSVSVLPGRTTALRERTNQFVVPPIYFHSSRRLQPTEKTNLGLVPSLTLSRSVSTVRSGPLFLFPRISFFLLTFHSRLPAPRRNRGSREYLDRGELIFSFSTLRPLLVSVPL